MIIRLSVLLASIVFTLFFSQATLASQKICQSPRHSASLSTQTIQHAINICSLVGGGRVKLSAGVWLSGPLLLKSNVQLYLSAGSRLTASYQGKQFKPGFISQPARAGEAFILAKNVRNVSVEGPGVIDGQGQKKWWPMASEARNHLRQGDTDWFAHHYPGVPPANGMPRPWLIEFAGVSGGEISQVSIENSPMWNVVIRDSQKITVINSTITNPSDSPNTDGIDVVSSQQVHLQSLNISTGDDDISIKSGLLKRLGSAECRNITVDHIRSENGHGISIGSETINGIAYINMHDLYFDGTENGIRIKSGRDRGANIDHISIYNVTMQDVKKPLIITDSYGGNGGYPSESIGQIEYKPVTMTTPRINNITIKKIKAIGAVQAGIFSGLPEAPLRNIILKSIYISAKTGLQSRYVSGRQKKMEIEVSSGKSQFFGERSEWNIE